MFVFKNVIQKSERWSMPLSYTQGILEFPKNLSFIQTVYILFVKENLKYIGSESESYKSIF